MFHSFIFCFLLLASIQNAVAMSALNSFSASSDSELSVNISQATAALLLGFFAPRTPGVSLTSGASFGEDDIETNEIITDIMQSTGDNLSYQFIRFSGTSQAIRDKKFHLMIVTERFGLELVHWSCKNSYGKAETLFKISGR